MNVLPDYRVNVFNRTMLESLGNPPTPLGIAWDFFRVPQGQSTQNPAVTEHTINRTEKINQRVIGNRCLYQHRPKLVLRIDD